MGKITVTRLAKELKTEADAYVSMEKMRWATGVVCPHCGSIAEHYRLSAEQMPAKKMLRVQSWSHSHAALLNRMLG